MRRWELVEDVFVMPSAWRRFVHPRRDRGRPVFRPNAKAIAVGAALPEKAKTSLGYILGDPRSDETLVVAGRAYLAGEATPIGAAVVRMAIKAPEHFEDRSRFAHYWIAEHGVVFAAEAMMRCARVTISFDRGGDRGRLSPHPGDNPFYLYNIDSEVEVIRSALAAASDADYAAAEAALEPLGGNRVPIMLRAALMPTRSDWVAESLSQNAIHHLWPLAAYCVGTTDDLAKLDRTQPIAIRPPVLYSLLDVVGPAIMPRLVTELDTHPDADIRKRTLAVLAALPTDKAFTALLDRLEQNRVQPAVLTAMRTFPQRAARLLSARALGDERIGALLRAHLSAHPDLELPADVRAVADEVTTAVGLLPVASPDLLPPLLAQPPWTRARKKVKPVVVTGLIAPEPSISWTPGEQNQWAAESGYWNNWTDDNWQQQLEQYQGRRKNDRSHYQPRFFVRAPEEMIRPLLAEWIPEYDSYAEEWGKVLVAKYGLDALVPVMRVVPVSPQAYGVLLVPFATIEIAELMADWFSRLKSARKHAMDWLLRHGANAVRLLIPAALGTPGAARKNAETALRFLGAQGHDLVTVASEFGDEARDGVRALVEVDQTELLPAKLPMLDAWADPPTLPQVRLRDGKHALPPGAVGHLLMTAALSRPGEVYAGLPIAREVCDPTSLSSLAWTVFERWLQAGAPPKGNWALIALGWFGGDETIRKLSPLVRQWPGESQHQRAVAALDVFAELGTEVALAHLNSIAEKVKFRALKERAQEKVAAIAARLGLSRDQLADRLVPRLGLDDTASLTIDYGARQFTVGFDEQLKPYVVDPDGKRRKDLPKPGARDDQAVAPDEYKRFTTLKKDVRTIAADQIHRLEAALITQRTWTAAEFHDVLAGHPLLWHIVRRLVWITDAGTSFRVAEDRTLANADDDAFVLPQDAVVRVAHPVSLSVDVVAAWGEVFADYEILQPFPQLGRPVYASDPATPLPAQLKQFQDVVVPVGKLLGLTKRGWVRGEPQDAGIECWISRPLPSGGAVVIGLEPGIVAGVVNEFPEQKLAELWYSPAAMATSRWGPTPAPAPTSTR